MEAKLLILKKELEQSDQNDQTDNNLCYSSVW